MFRRKQNKPQVPYHRNLIERTIEGCGHIIGYVAGGVINGILGIFGAHVSLSAKPKSSYLEDGSHYNPNTGYHSYQHTFGAHKGKKRKLKEIKQASKQPGTGASNDSAIDSLLKHHNDGNGF